MLVIISDLHLTDGTSGETIAAHAFRIFRDNLGDMIYETSWQADGKHLRVCQRKHPLLARTKRAALK